MESGIQSSFIPHDAAQPVVPRVVTANHKGLSDLLLLLAIVLFVASAALGAAVFLYDQYAQSSAASKLDQLKRARAAFEPSLIQELTRLDDRMSAAQQVLGNHIAPTALFKALQESTLSTVSFTTLSFEGGDSQRLTIKMTGVAQSVNSIALQADLFSKSGIVTNPIFSDITRQADGVHFTVNALVNPQAVNYQHVLASGGVSAVQPAQEAAFSPQGSAQLPAAPQQASTTPNAPADAQGGAPRQ